LYYSEVITQEQPLDFNETTFCVSERMTCIISKILSMNQEVRGPKHDFMRIVVLCVVGSNTSLQYFAFQSVANYVFHPCSKLSVAKYFWQPQPKTVQVRLNSKQKNAALCYRPMNSCSSQWKFALTSDADDSHFKQPKFSLQSFIGSCVFHPAGRDPL